MIVYDKRNDVSTIALAIIVNKMIKNKPTS